jgi:hypothetical protein
MADRVDVGPCLVDAAVDDALAVEGHIGRRDRLGIEREFQNVGRLDQLGAARAGEQVAPAVARVAHADVAEAVEHAFVRDDAVGERKLVAGFGEGIWHGGFPDAVFRPPCGARKGDHFI